MKRKIRIFIEDHILLLFMIFVGILTYMVGLRDRAEAEAFENEIRTMTNETNVIYN